MGEKYPDRDEVVGHDETADNLAHNIKVDSFEHWMNKVDSGAMSFETAIECYQDDLRQLGEAAIRNTGENGGR